MRTAHKTMLLAVVGGLAAGILDALFDFLFFHEGSFLDVLVFELTPMEMYFRCTLFLLFVIFGLIQIKFAARAEHTERALRESEEKFRVLFESAPVGLAVTNMGGDLIAFNEAILKPGGYAPEDMAAVSLNYS